MVQPQGMKLWKLSKGKGAPYQIIRRKGVYKQELALFQTSQSALLVPNGGSE